MKRVYLFALAAFAMSASSMAQRSIDWSVEEIVKPTEIKTNTTSGSDFDIEVVLKNNGPDAVVSGDTVLYNIVFMTSTNQVIFAYPSASGFQTFTSSRAFAVGDTMHGHVRLNWPQFPNGSVNAKLRVASLVINRGSNKVADEPAANQANNIKIKDMMWWNPQGWAVGINEISNNILMEVYPNPAQGSVTVSYNISNVQTPNQVAIYDIQGQLVQSFTSVLGAKSDKLDISALPAGIYVVKVKSGDLESQQKLQILK